MFRIFKTITTIFSAGAKGIADIKDGDSISVGARKLAVIAAKRTVYIFVDYWLAGLCAMLIVGLKVLEVPLFYAYIITWGVSILIAGVFLVIYARTGHDISLGEDLRRATDAIHKKSKCAGYLSLFGVIMQATVWSGPEQIVIFFKKEIGSMPKMVAVMLCLTALQSGVWMYIYRLGYDSISQLFTF